MKRKEFITFWAGFFIAAAVVAWLYWLWQQRREVTPRPLIIASKEPENLPLPEEALPEEEQKPRGQSPAPDDLTVIKGIGPVFAGRLNKAGIFTYAQLADQTPEQLQFITQVTRWDPADWIEEAKKLA